jgi:hypothetical protein
MVALPRRRCRLSDATRIRQIGGHGAEIELSKGVVQLWRTPLRHRFSRNHAASLRSASYLTVHRQYIRETYGRFAAWAAAKGVRPNCVSFILYQPRCGVGGAYREICFPCKKTVRLRMRGESTVADCTIKRPVAGLIDPSCCRRARVT